MGNQWGDIYLCVPQPKCCGDVFPPSPYNRRPWWIGGSYRDRCRANTVTRMRRCVSIGSGVVAIPRRWRTVPLGARASTGVTRRRRRRRRRHVLEGHGIAGVEPSQEHRGDSRVDHRATPAGQERARSDGAPPGEQCR